MVKLMEFIQMALILMLLGMVFVEKYDLIWATILLITSMMLDNKIYELRKEEVQYDV